MKDRSFVASTSAIFLFLLISIFAASQQPAARITQRIDPSQRVTLHGNVHPLARAEFDHGPAPDSMIVDRMLLVLSRSDEQEQVLRRLLEDQQTVSSPNYHKWLTPEEFGQQFGVSDFDLQTVTTWLMNNGFQVTSVGPGRNVIEFSGTAGQLRQAFHTDMHRYTVKGQERWANADDPQIPVALAPVVKGIASLNSFPRRPMSNRIRGFKRDTLTGEAGPLVTTSNTPPYYLLGPGDFSVIYGSKSLVQSGNNGAGQSIAIIGRTNINLQDVTDFRNLFSLPNSPDNHTSVILNGPDPGIVDGDVTEAILDVEWSGAVAPGASIILVSSMSTLSSDGIDLSSLYAVEHNVAPIISVSYGTCEFYLGNAGNLYYQSLWEQAAAQGITVLVASGDDGSAGCDNPNSQDVATHGIAVNGVASTPFNVAVGGTDFNDASTQTTYFNTTNAADWTSAKSYIPEIPWNDSCAGGLNPTTNSCTSSANKQLWSGSGGPSNCSKLSGSSCTGGTTKPSWQTGTGVPTDGVRDVPDVALFAASGTAGSHSIYIICEADLVSGYPSCQDPGSGGGYIYFGVVAGTSASAPSFAGAVALANQKVGKRLGNLNYLLYPIASQSGNTCNTSSATSTCVFHDITQGSNSVPCQGGTPKCSATSSSQTGVLVDSSKLAYVAGTGYDRATGLGSPNIANLVNAVSTRLNGSTASTTTLTLNGGAAPVTASHGQAINVGVSVSPTTATGDVSILGNNGTTDFVGIDGAKLTSGTASWNSTSFPGGNYTVHAHYGGDGTRRASDSAGISVNISPENSRTFVNLVTPTSFTATSAEYGSPYILQMNVGDSAATISSTTGISSKCSSGTVSCPTGTLTVTANGSPLDGGSWKLNNVGQSEDQPIQLTPGSYNIVANYPGDASYNASSGSTNITIGKATTSFSASTVSGSTFEYGSTVDLTGSLTTSSNGAAPSGNVTLLDNGVDPGSSVLWSYIVGSPADRQGPAYATYVGRYLPSSLGTHTITAHYVGDSNYAGVTAAPFSFTVTQAQLHPSWSQVSPTLATPAIPVTLSVNLSSYSSLNQTPSGAISFYDNGVLLSGTVSYTRSQNWISATMTYTFTQTGQHTITAGYSGDTYFAALSSSAVGTVTVSDKLTPSMQTGSSFTPALVNYATTITTLVSVPVWGTPNPTGTVTFADNGQPMSGTVTYSGTSPLYATLPYTFTASGTHNITANYSGDSIYAAATSSLSLNVVDKFTTTIPYLNGPTNFVANTPSTLSVTVQSSAMYQGPAMTGTVTFSDGSTQITGTATVYNQSGYMIVELPYTFTTVGAHTITVQYSGDDHYAATSKTFSVQVMGPLALQLQSDTYSMGAGGGNGTLVLWIYNNISSSQTVVLTCASDSASASCTITPNSISMGGNSGTSALINFTVPALSASAGRGAPFTMPFLFAGVLVGLCIAGHKRRALALMVVATILAIGMISCGGGGSSSPPPPPPPSSKVYKFTVTGTAGADTESKVLTVTVQR